jgi:hypothetical protein
MYKNFTHKPLYTKVFLQAILQTKHRNIVLRRDVSANTSFDMYANVPTLHGYRWFCTQQVLPHIFFTHRCLACKCFYTEQFLQTYIFFQHNRFLHADALMGIFVFGKQKSIHTNVLHPGAFTDGLVLHAFACRKLGHPDVRAHTCFNTKKSTQKLFTHRCLLLHTFPHKEDQGCVYTQMFLLYTRTVYIRILPAQVLIYSLSTRSSWGRVRRAQATSQIYLNLRWLAHVSSTPVCTAIASSRSHNQT